MIFFNNNEVELTENSQRIFRYAIFKVTENIEFADQLQNQKELLFVEYDENIFIKSCKS